MIPLAQQNCPWVSTWTAERRGSHLRIRRRCEPTLLGASRQRDLLSDAHCTVDDTLLEAWAGHKSFRRTAGKPGETPSYDHASGNPTVDFNGQ